MRLSPTKVKEHRIYTDGLALPQIQGTSVYTELRRAQPEQSSEAPLSGLPSAAAEFVRDGVAARLDRLASVDDGRELGVHSPKSKARPMWFKR